jgi:predicted TIM-barrel fold metal-dependent hydrolase
MRAHLRCLVLLLAAASCRCPTRTAVQQRKIDVHVHVGPSAVPRLVSLMDERDIEVSVNLSGGWPGEGLEQSMAAARRVPGRIVVFANPPLWRLRTGDVDFEAGLVEAKRLGARGVKIYKALGLGYRGPDGSLVAVDDARLDGLFEKAGELGLPVAIHTGDPLAF